MKLKPAPASRSLSRSRVQIICQRLSLVIAFAAAMAISTASSHAQTAKKPNILVIFGDDIGQSNLSAYTFGVMGYKTPNIDRIANEGMKFTDYYAENSCTAGWTDRYAGSSGL